MKLKKFSFINHKTGWQVEDVSFGPLSLLVGASGVGKTLILKAISDLTRIADGHSVNGREWNVEFEEAGINYNWTGRFNVVKNVPEIFVSDKAQFPILEERLIKEDTEIVFSRKDGGLFYHNSPTVKLDATKSAVELLKEEEDVAPAYRAFRKISWLDMEDGNNIRLSLRNVTENHPQLSLKDIKNLKFITPIERLFFIQRHHTQVFNQIKETFMEIFPLVEEIDFDVNPIQAGHYAILLKIKEHNVKSWILMPDISSGMCRTLSQIVTLSLADDGDVIMIDEFENGLGINCIDLLADMAKDTDADVQIIMTSHHPYIINTIPFQDWRIVSRNGSKVVVNTAADFRIGSHSKHDAFMQLIQTNAYRTGQA